MNSTYYEYAESTPGAWLPIATAEHRERLLVRLADGKLEMAGFYYSNRLEREDWLDCDGNPVAPVEWFKKQ